MKGGAELSTDHHLVVCTLRLDKLLVAPKPCRSNWSYRVKWEALADKSIRKEYADKVLSKYRKLPVGKEDIKTEWELFKTAIISCAEEV